MSETFTRDDWTEGYQQIKTERQERLRAALDNLPTKHLFAHSPRLLQASLALLDRIDNITTEDFQRGGEKKEREELRKVIAVILDISAEDI